MTTLQQKLNDCYARMAIIEDEYAKPDGYVSSDEWYALTKAQRHIIADQVEIIHKLRTALRAYEHGASSIARDALNEGKEA
jgi:hypothetical protein